MSVQAIDTEALESLRAKLSRHAILEDKELCELSLIEFLKGAWSSLVPSTYKNSWAIDATADHLEAVASGHIRRLLINVPPRCAKTTLCSIVYPAWIWVQQNPTFLTGPQVRFLCASYNHELSLLNATAMRKLTYSPWFQKRWPNHIILEGDQNSKHNFANTAGGARISTSVGGSLLGLGGDILIADDLNKTGGKDEVVETDAERENVKTFWNEFSSTRLNDQNLSALINIQQRVHEEDVSGLILDSADEWTHLMIPMRYDPERSFHTIKLPQYDDEEAWKDPREYEGELMWPEMFDEAGVKRLERILGPYMASGRLQQIPTPKGGGIIKSDWWQLWDQNSARLYGLEWNGARREFPHFELVIGSLDTSYKEKEENDFNALTIWGIFLDRARNRRAMLAYAWAKRLPLHGTDVQALPGETKIQYDQRKKEEWGLVEWVADTCKRYRVRRLLIEDKARGHDVASELNRLYKRDNWGVELVNPVGDKVSRTHSIVPIFTDHCIWAPDLSWSDKVIKNCASFPKASHDDLHDTVTQFCSWARENGVLMLVDEASAALEDDARYAGTQQNSVARNYGV